MDSQVERPQYYDGEYLGAADLEASVRYSRDGLARHELGAHLWGIAVGLDLVERPLPSGDVEMVLTPGVAWDGYARRILALAPRLVTLELFENFQDATDPAGIPVPLWLQYEELAALPPGPGFACPDDALFGRVVEGYRMEVRRGVVTDPHNVTVAARSIAATAAESTFNPGKGPLHDESVPQQDFSERGNRDRWPIFVGFVRWRKDVGQPGRLLARTDADRNDSRAGRRYLGTVAETIVAPDGLLRLRDRSKDPAAPATNLKPPIVAPAGSVNDLVWCEGHLRVVGDARLQDGKLDYLVVGGGDGGVPVHLRRTSVNPPASPIPKTTLDAFIGPPPGPPGPVVPETRFTVSTTDAANNPKECLTVVTDGRVGINAADPTNTLQVEGPTGVRYKFGYLSGDDQSPAAASFSYNAYSPPGGPWKFADPAHKAAAVVLDDAGGVPQLKLQTNQNTNPASPWTAHVVVKGDTGNVGIGNLAPAARLHVRGAPIQGELLLFNTAATSDLEYDGGSNGLFVVRNTGSVTAFMGGDVGLETLAPRARLEVVGNAKQHGTATFVPDGGKGPQLSHIHWGGTGDWYVRSAAPNGTVVIQDTGGNVGIGTATPADRLYVKDPASVRITVEAGTNGYAGVRMRNTQREYFTGIQTNSGRWCVHDNNVDVERLTVAANGRVGINDSSPAYDLDVNGDIHLTGDVYNDGFGYYGSDARLKRYIAAIDNPLGRLLALRGVTFEWAEPEKHANATGRYMGLLAQEVEQVFPEWVKTTPAGTKAVGTIGFEGLVVEAVRELSARCERLEQEVASLRGRKTAAGGDTPATKPVKAGRVQRKKPRARAG